MFTVNPLASMPQNVVAHSATASAFALAPGQASAASSLLIQAVSGNVSPRASHNNLAQFESSLPSRSLTLSAVTGKPPVDAANLVYAQSFASSR